MSECPCESGEKFEACCYKYISKAEFATTAEKTMRARYSAFVKSDLDFIRDSFHPDKRSDYSEDEIAKWATESDWKGLTIESVEGGLENDDEGKVEFKARYSLEGIDHIHHELSTFKKLEDTWYFYEGQLFNSTIKRSETKIGRNDPCSCGSGKKFKKCCLK